MLIGNEIALRPVCRDDAEMLTGWFNEPELMSAFYNHWPCSKEMVLERIDNARRGKGALHCHPASRR
jgi:hypothetical protein